MHNGHGRPPRPPSGRQPGISTSNNRTGTNSQSGQGGGPPGRGDTGPSQAAIESARRANAAQPKAWSQEERQEEKGIDIYGNIVEDTFDPTWAGEREKRYESPQDYYGDVQGSINLGKALRKVGINQDQLKKYMDANILPENVARAMGLVQPGEHWDPRGKFTKEMKEDLEDLQFMQDEGVYGGVSGLEAEVNKQKGELHKVSQDLINEKAQEIIQKNPKISNEELDKQLNIFKTSELKNKMLQSGDTNLESLARLFGKADEYGKVSPDYSTALMNTFGMRDPAYGSEDAWEATFKGKEGEDIYKSAYDVGYDPTGAYTFSDIESDPNLYDKYLSSGENWEDPLSGVLKPRGPKFIGGGGGGGGWPGWGGYGGGGGGGGGYYGPQAGYTPEQMAGFYTPQANLQQAMVNVHQTPTGFQPGYKRGGIVSLLGLRS